MAGEASWSIAVNVLAFIIAIIFTLYYYLRYKKLFLIFFIVSVTTYIAAVFYTWDVFELNKNWILLMLAVSTAIMFFLGRYFSHIKLTPINVQTSLKKKNI